MDEILKLIKKEEKKAKRDLSDDSVEKTN